MGLATLNVSLDQRVDIVCKNGVVVGNGLATLVVSIDHRVDMVLRGNRYA